jgi:hypothetical protein
VILLNVPCGTEVQTRKIGESEWRTHRTKKTNRFPNAAVTEDGYYLFEHKGWEMKVHPNSVNRSVIETNDPPKNPAVPVDGPPFKPHSFGSTGGKGSSRRRNMRAAKRRK